MHKPAENVLLKVSAALGIMVVVLGIGGGWYQLLSAAEQTTKNTDAIEVIEREQAVEMKVAEQFQEDIDDIIDDIDQMDKTLTKQNRLLILIGAKLNVHAEGE